MTRPSLSSACSYSPDALPRHVAEAVWRGSEVSDAVSRTISSGFPELDAQLPGKGWPTHCVTEILMPQAALCEWRLLGRSVPGFTTGGGRVYLIAPPKQPHAGGLAQIGLSADEVVWIDASSPADRLWATEQIVKSDPSGAVLSWVAQARPEQIRRLQIHAQSCDAPVFLFRPVATLSEASPAPLRVTAALATGWYLEVRIPKRRGASVPDPVYLAAIPTNLAAVLPPRLQSIPAPAAALLREETSDARALGRIAAPPSAGQPVSH